MNLSSLLSAPASSGSGSGSVARGMSAGPSAESSSGAFDALVTARAGIVDGTTAPSSPLPEANETATVDAAPTASASLSPATMAMLAALDRSATMLSQSQGTGAASEPSTGKDDKPVAAAASPADTGGAIPAALIAALTAVGRALPTIASAPQVETDGTVGFTASATPVPKAPVRELPTAAPTSALFNAIAAELRPMFGGKVDLVDKSADPLPEAAKDMPNGMSIVSPTSAMIRDLASLIANSVTPTAPAEGVAVDRHLDLARDDAWLNDLARDIAATAANGGRLKFGLAPESLGRLDVEIRQGQAGVSVHMTTRTETARDLLSAAQPRIADEIRAQGVRVAGTEVSTDASGSGAGFGGDRAGSTLRQPFALPIDAALAAPSAASSETSKSVADGRYA